jgi:hypothetical protein
MEFRVQCDSSAGGTFHLRCTAASFIEDATIRHLRLGKHWLMNRLIHSVCRAARLLIVSSIALLAIESAAWANLNPGDTQYNPALSPTFTPSFSIGAVPAAYNTPVASAVFPYNYNGTPSEAFAGTVTSSVFKNGSGQLAFSYVFTNTTPTPSEITRATINDPSNPWSGISIFGVGSDAGGSSTAVPGAFGSWTNGNPFSIQRDAVDQGISMAFNSFNSGTQLRSPSDRSATIWFTTDATHFTRTNIGLIDGGTVGTSNAFAPVVPEPSTIVLSAFGFFGVALMVRRGRQSKSSG